MTTDLSATPLKKEKHHRAREGKSSLPVVLSVSDLDVTFVEETGELKVLRNINFDIYEHQFVCLLGPSGSGKSTLLRVLSDLLPPTKGTATYPHATQPKISYVFQDANLLPWRTVLKNITLPLEIAGMDAKLADEKAMQLIHLTNLQGFENSNPQDLSGGMAQRVAIARALIQEPDILLMDEPFGSLDALTREKMSGELLNIWQEQRITVLMVTHSISEAILLSDRVLVITPRPGCITLDLEINLPRPRNDDMRFTPPFGELARLLRSSIQA
ncbi:MAG: ABC transporter ATP-binding protein [Anaerolineaceae bacterium]|nr:ABC transporter ATP-binding protein [Anaerolineaceae bacterium]